MSDNYERYFEISLPRAHKLAERVNGSAKPGENPFRTQIALKLGELFGTDIFTLEEAHIVGEKKTEGNNGSKNDLILSYKIAVKTPKTTEFLQKLEELNKAEELNLGIREIAVSETRRKAGSATRNLIDSDSKSDGNV